MPLIWSNYYAVLPISIFLSLLILKFTLKQENEVMGLILDDGLDGTKAAEKWLKANPKALDGWLKDVTTIDGKPGLAAVKKSLGL